MNLKVSSECFEGSVTPPSSKSHTHRSILIAASANGTSTIKNPLICDDTLATIKAAEAFGAEIITNENNLIIYGTGLHLPTEPINAQNSGTLFRFACALAASLKGDTKITGDSSVLSRPHEPLYDALRKLGCRCQPYKDGIIIKGPVSEYYTKVDCSKSSQYLSALLLASPLFNEVTTIHYRNLVSEPYVEITKECMLNFHSEIIDYEGKTELGKGYFPTTCEIPMDWSSAAFLLAAGAVGGFVSIPITKIPKDGDSAIIEILKNIGADVKIDNDSITVSKSELNGLNIDMKNIPDLFPILASVLSVSKGRSILYGAPQLRFKESDRISATVKMLRSMGANIWETDDGCVIEGVPYLEGGTIDSENDHRIIMSACVLSVKCRNPVTIKNAECYSVSYPDFIINMESLGLVTKNV